MYGVYIHAPWCKRRCPYCAFNVYVESSPPFQEWTTGVLRDWSEQTQHFVGEPTTIYFGGGTPSLIPPESLKTIIKSLNPLAQEITLEANPEDITSSRLQQYQEMGINRLSIGVQTFNVNYQKQLGRGTSIQQAKTALRLVQKAAFSSWSFDLMFGLPNQSVDDLRKDLDEILTFLPPHISLYGLTYEEGTGFHHGRRTGRLQDISEDTWVEMFDLIGSTLQQAGYERYEVSNFALPGHRSTHNNSIWRNGPYGGLGPGAHAFFPNKERLVQASGWESWKSGSRPQTETPTLEQQAIDAVLTWIRHIDGINQRELAELGFQIDLQSLEPLVSSGHLMVQKNDILLGKHGWSVVDSITRQLISKLHPIAEGANYGNARRQ